MVNIGKQMIAGNPKTLSKKQVSGQKAGGRQGKIDKLGKNQNKTKETRCNVTLTDNKIQLHCLFVLSK